jgi:hypothetical protein
VTVFTEIQDQVVENSKSSNCRRLCFGAVRKWR